MRRTQAHRPRCWVADVSTYDPWTRDDQYELDRERAARREHERWSYEQSLKGNDALHRDPEGIWQSHAGET